MNFERTLYGKKEILTKRHNFVLEYYLTTIQGTKKPLYGIEISKKQNNVVLETEVVHNISDVLNTVEVIIGKLINHAVTPVTMLNILDDLGDPVDASNLVYRAC